LQTAIPLQMFDVHYQPIVAAAGGAIIGVEALVRWNHPTRGDIPPSVFVPLAEQSGMMSQLGEIVLRRALADAARWPHLSVAVNLSPVQIRDRWLVDLVAAVIQETEIDPSRVVLEVTEGVLIDNPQETQARLEALRALGVSVALDDFGTGYSSLSYLQRFPFDRLKIDRAFVASLGTSPSTGAIIQAIVTLGHGLGMKVLAEGVETEEQRVLLRLAGCDEMQGYLFARPGPAAEIDDALARTAKSLVS
jgi:EAL domain-containing protein (putative c-di-GMP-specific phosphodiesterase class I)